MYILTSGLGTDEYMQVCIGIYSHRDDRSYFSNNFPANNFAADNNCLKVPEKFDDNQAVLLSDILPTAWHGNELGGVGEGDNVAIWGAGPGKILNQSTGFAMLPLCSNLKLISVCTVL